MSCLHHCSCEAALPVPFSSYTVYSLASPCSATQYQSESHCNSLYYSLVGTQQITYSPQTTHLLLMNSVLQHQATNRASYLGSSFLQCWCTA